MTDLVSKAKQAGINITLQSSNFNYMISNYLDPYAPANENKWAMQDFGGETNSTYPTTFSLFNTGGSNQVGNYSNPTGRQADQRLHHQQRPGRGQGRGGVPHHRSADRCSSPTTTTPGLGRPTSSATKPEAWENLTQYYTTPEYWYLNS